MKNNKKILTLAAIYLCCSSVYANQTAFISDNIKVFMHSGSSIKYRITGSIKAGEEIEVLDKKNNFYKIKTKNKEGWISASSISFEPSIKTKLNKLKKDYNSYKIETENQLTYQNKQINNLEEEKNKLIEDIEKQKLTNMSFAEKIDEISSKSIAAISNKIMERKNNNTAYNVIFLILGIMLGLFFKKRPKNKLDFKNKW